MKLFTFDITLSLGEAGRILEARGEIDEGSVLVLKGPSGAGKSSLLRAFALLRTVSHGDMTLSGQSMTQLPPPLWRRKVHYLAQQPYMGLGSVKENLLSPFSLQVMHNETIPSPSVLRELMDEMLLDVSLDQDAQTLSGGERVRISLIKSLLVDPQLLLLDEPTASLDNESRSAVLQTLVRWLTHNPLRAIAFVSHIDDDYRVFSSTTIYEVGGSLS